MEWVRSCLTREGVRVVDANGINVEAWRPGSAICARWPSFIEPDCNRVATFRQLVYYYKAGGFNSFELCKLPHMSVYPPPAHRLDAPALRR